MSHPDDTAQPADDDAIRATVATADPAPTTDVPRVVKRHRLSTRIWHWTNALTVFVMLMSGLMIFNAHPRLYWGQYGANFDHAWLELGTEGDNGFLDFAGTRIGTSGILAVSCRDEPGRFCAFPGWATIPSTYDLAGARRWHLSFAWVLALSLLFFMIRIFINRHAQRDLTPKASELTPKHIWHEIKDHARLRFPTGLAALNYNTLQKLSYFGVIFFMLPLIILTGLTMSPGMDAAWPWLLDLFGGRQSARSIHFIVAFMLVGFVVVHLVMVVLAGPINEIRSMITGRYRVPQPKPPKPPKEVEPIPAPMPIEEAKA